VSRRATSIPSRSSSRNSLIIRRAIVAAVGTAVGLAALLSYKSSGSDKLLKVQVSTGQNKPAATLVTPATSKPGGSTAGSAPSTTAPSTTPSSTIGAPPSTATAEHTYTGQEIQYIYGDIVVAATLQNGKIANISVPQNDATDGRSQMINSYAVPILEQEAVTAQGVNINVVSGATFTSDAFAQSLQTALTRAGK
jgi:uncharacterized protein with FMN-binding domain